MGFFDKMKTFAGGHGVKLEITQIERLPPADSFLPATDTVLKGKFAVTSTQEQVVLAHVATFNVWLQTEKDGQRHNELARERYDGKDIWGVDFPYTIKPGETVEGAFILTLNPTVQDAITKLGYTVEGAVADKNMHFDLKVEADVKGTPIDASASHHLRIVPGND